MKPWTLELYRCPMTGTPLKVEPIEEVILDVPDEARALMNQAGMPDSPQVSDIRTGVLSSTRGYWYPIINHVPVLLDFDNGAYDHFEEQQAEHAGFWSNKRRPHREPREGEALTQQTFTREWDELQVADELSFTYDADERRRFIALEIGVDDLPLDPNYVTLDIGSGSGREAEHLAAVTGRHVFGVDLNLSVLKSGALTAANPLTHSALASVFRLPFAPETFDLVYSHGVLHHTFNTKRAFTAADTFRKPDGSIYIWVYALEDAQRGGRSRARSYAVERVLRRRIAAMPDRAQRALIELMARRHYRRYRKSGLKKDAWDLRHSRHSMRDRWTPPFAHRHSFHEVISWFVDKDLDYELVDPVAFRTALDRNLFGIGIRGSAKQQRLETA